MSRTGVPRERKPVIRNKPREDLEDKGSEAYRAYVAEGLERMAKAATEINDSTAERKRKVPEAYFVNILLPVLRKWIRREEVEIGHYLNVADGLNNEIEVVDQEGVKLYDVPPLFVDVPTRVARHEPGVNIPTIHKLVQIQGMHVDNNDMRQVFTIENDLVDILAPRAEDASKTRCLVMLCHIYDRYELPLEELVGETLAPVIAAALRAAKKPGTKAIAESGNNARSDDDFIID